MISKLIVSPVKAPSRSTICKFLKEACKKFPNKIALGLDAKGGHLSVFGWTEKSNQLTFDFL